jgi:DNA excision repair protein ERCC-1
LQNAVNAQPEQINSVPGWGEKKVQQWCNAVREDFRVESTKKAAAPRPATQTKPPRLTSRPRQAEFDEDEEILRAVLAESRETAAVEAAAHQSPPKSSKPAEELSDGIMAALAKLRDTDG